MRRAGPAGLFSAYELSKKNKNLKILLIDKGKFAKKRCCPIAEKKKECINCKPCQILSGYGGAGTFSDGKLNFIPKLLLSSFDLFNNSIVSSSVKKSGKCSFIFKQRSAEMLGVIVQLVCFCLVPKSIFLKESTNFSRLPITQ